MNIDVETDFTRLWYLGICYHFLLKGSTSKTLVSSGHLHPSWFR